MSVRGGLGTDRPSRPDDPLGVRRLAPSWRFACSRGWRTYAAATDELTGLPNRRALYAEGHARLAVPQRGRHALLMLDLDKFRGVNDSLGYDAAGYHLARPMPADAFGTWREQRRLALLHPSAAQPEQACQLPRPRSRPGEHRAVVNT
jgi:Diguanylate cyclase, GGDEF domain